MKLYIKPKEYRKKTITSALNLKKKLLRNLMYFFENKDKNYP